MKSLVVYFSLSATTKKAAQRIQRLIDADIFEIKGNKNYDSYLKAVAICGKEIVTKEKPVVTTHIEDIDAYDCIILGFPIWYGNCPRIIRTFMDEYDFKDKDVYVFCTSGSSSCDKALKTVAESCAGAHVHSALRIDNQSDNEIKAWLHS